MIGLTGARVIVVDDDEKEALPILKAFAKKGMPAAFFDGNLRSLPTKTNRLSGVRLAILDMDLVGGGVPENTKASMLVKYLEKILSPQNGPYVTLVWTNHPELLEPVERYLFSNKSVPIPIFTVMLTKAECKNPRGKFDLAVLSGKLDEALKNISPLLLLQVWEEKCFAAATEVTNTLSGLATSDAPDLNGLRILWKSRLLQLLYAIAQEAVGKRLDNDSILKGLYGSLDPLHADRMESRTAGLSRLLAAHTADILGSPAGCSVEQKARVNTMLHLASEGLGNFCAGNIYKFSARKKPKLFPSAAHLLYDMRQTEKDTQKDEEMKAEMLEASTPIFIEISAACDHAQKNVRIARFLAGLIVPVAKSKRIKKADYIWRLGPVFLEPPIATKGEYYFYFSSRHLATHNLKQALGLKAALRLRNLALADLQAWFAHHAARPGIMLLGEKLK